MIAALLTFLHETRLGRAIYLLLIAMLPVIELRGALPMAAILDVPLLEAYILCVVGNIIPVPFLVLFGKKLFGWLKRGILRNAVQRFESRVGRKAEIVRKYRALGLFLFVMIPLPGTGAWTGSLIAAVLDMRIRDSFFVILSGVMVAGVIMTGLSYGVTQVFAG